jgi:lysophospholipase L1-like esterase
MPTKRDWWNKEFRVLMTVGDSITAGGWASCRERRWTNLLAQMIGELQRNPVQLVNVGIGANIISSKFPGYKFSQKPALDERLEDHVLSNSANGNPIVPDLLVIAQGLNEASFSMPVGMFTDEMEKIIARIRAKFNPLIVLLGPYHVADFTVGRPNGGQGSTEASLQYNEATHKLAEKLDCLYVDVLSAMSGADWMVHFDGVHSNDLGHRVVANKVFEVLASNCSGLAIETKAIEKSILPWRDEAVLHPGK